MRELGLSTCGGKDLSDAALAAYRAAGVQTLEFSFETALYDTFDFAANAARVRAAGMSVFSVHLPFLPFETNNIASVDPAVSEQTVRDLTLLLRRVAEAEVHTVVIHPSGEPNDPATRRLQLEHAKSALAALAEIADGLGIVVAVEDLPRTCLGNCSEEILELISVDPRLMVCFDTNHLLGEDLVAFVRRVGSRIHTLHLSDYDFADERHWMPGEGDIDWPAVMAALDEVGYRGPMMYELGFKTPKSMDREGDLTPADFAENCAALLRGEQPRAIGARKENLGSFC